ncbi:hypothetical protein MAHJHV57_47390 [Mycobacterium avium subsp. hominissuis]
MADLTGRDFAKAREIFFNYDGSRFYMSRDGVEAEYERFSVPKEVENKWLEELTTHKLSMLVGLTPDGGHPTGGTVGPAGRMSVCRASVASTPRSFGSRLLAW